jgi:hypothetical protein
MAHPDDDIKIGLTNPLHAAIGEAIEGYVRVEANLATLLAAILKIDTIPSLHVMFAVQNARARNELFQSLLAMQYGATIKRYWASCSKFLLTLSQFRNAIAHWHPGFNLYLDGEGDTIPRAVHALHHPTMVSPLIPLETTDLSRFMTDCQHIREELSALITLFRERPSPLPDKFRQPITHRNLAVLRQRPTPKGQQRQQRPSRLLGQHKARKLSAKQRRARALAMRARKSSSSDS